MTGVGTIEGWCEELVLTRDLARKLAPGPPPDPRDPLSWGGSSEVEADPKRPGSIRPGRPPELRVAERSPRTPRDLGPAPARAQLVHSFLHHELQAAELFAWAVLAFPDTPRDFRAGLVRLCQEELAHLALYAEHLTRLGSSVGAFPVRDWFWLHVARCEDATAFVSLMGLGLEGANLEHAARFAARFREAGDIEGARIMDRVEREEIGHVAFALHWYERFTGAPLDYDRWRAALPEPLSPSVMRGSNLNRAARARAGFDETFLARLESAPSTTIARGRDT